MTLGVGLPHFHPSPKLPMILQDERAECGHACVAMISNYWGHHLDLYSLRSIRNTSSKGVTLLDINQLFEQLGFATRPLQVPIESLHLIKCPAILHWNMNHFVVLKRVKKNKIVIHDPAFGVRHCSVDELSQAFTGIVLEVEKSSNFQAIRSHSKLTLYHLFKTIQGCNRFLILIILLSLSIEVLSLLNPLFMQYVTDDVIGFSEQSNLYVIAVGFLLLVLIQVGTEYMRGTMVIYFTNNLTEQFSSNVVKHLLKLPLAFFEKRHKGDLQSKFQSIDHIQKKISTDFITTLLDGLMIVINFIIMAFYNQVLTTIVVAALLICLGLRYLSYQQLRKQTECSLYQHAKAMTVFLETLQGILPIKSFLKESVRYHGWRNCYINALNADIYVSRMNLFYQVANQLLFHIEHIVVVCIGASYVLSHQCSLGMLFAFLSYRLLFVNKASSFIQHVFDYKLISIQLGRLSDILFQKPEVLGNGTASMTLVKGDLTLNNVFFKYNDNEPAILNDVTIDIKAGEKIVIVGPSGCGKSTLLKIMMGLLESTDGDIYIDHIPLKDFGLKNYRELTASVMQNDALLSGSIIDNISFFDEQIDRDRVYQVAKLAFIHEDICKFPMGYETLVGDMGSTLSGGQKQRVLLARALYKQPKILFLDEATSHLDVDNEKNINQALKTLDITQIIIAHRQETIQMADRVLQLGVINQVL